MITYVTALHVEEYRDLQLIHIYFVEDILFRMH